MPWTASTQNSFMYIYREPNTGNSFVKARVFTNDGNLSAHVRIFTSNTTHKPGSNMRVDGLSNNKYAFCMSSTGENNLYYAILNENLTYYLGIQKIVINVIITF
jgi:hypothetical protein